MLNSLHVVMVASEAVPFAKSGGLADVTGALPKALAALGQRVSLIMPRYPLVERAVRSLEKVHQGVDVPMGSITEHAVIWSAKLAPKIPVYFIDHPGYFGREHLYTSTYGDYPDNAHRFAFFAKAALAACRELALAPDILHCHDWQAALIPAYLKTTPTHAALFATVGSLLTIHNLAYQGLFPPEVMTFLELPPETYSPDGIEFYGQVNFLKAGIVYADLINTVSRRYSEQIQTGEFGCGLDGILRHRSQQVYGIVNGIDDREWNPATDRLIPARYRDKDLAGKQVCKRTLLETVGLPLDLLHTPVVGMVSRLVDQKGLDLVEQAFHRMLALDLGLVVLGEGEARYVTLLREMQQRYPTKVGVSTNFDNALAHKIVAGSDVFLIPSHFEPCGLSLMYSLRYGTVPVVHATGGLDDLVEPYDSSFERGNGFKFAPYEAEAMLGALQQALLVYRDHTAWELLIRRAMQGDFSWTRSAQEYLALYGKALATRQGTTVPR